MLQCERERERIPSFTKKQVCKAGEAESEPEWSAADRAETGAAACRGNKEKERAKN